MKKQFSVSHNGKIVGSFFSKDIAAMLHAKTFESTDYLYDEELANWVLLIEHPEVMEHLKGAQTMEVSMEEPTKGPEWFLLKGENQTGPFNYPDMVKMLQDKVIFDFDYVWKAGMDAWKRVAEVDIFSKQNIHQLKNENQYKEVFFKRRFKRKDYGGTLIVHDNNTVWHGKSIEISEGGAGIVMNNSMIMPGQTLYMHFRPSHIVPAFNVFVEVVSKKYVKGVNKSDAPVMYGVRFLKIQSETRQLIQTFVGEVERKTAA